MFHIVFFMLSTWYYGEKIFKIIDFYVIQEPLGRALPNLGAHSTSPLFQLCLPHGACPYIYRCIQQVWINHFFGANFCILVGAKRDM
jgi:hypothetical protein